ncbi:MAG: hypothetical protein A2248_11735 [Candidatus Raymondbacteria bacterium RIFOXYA2_FULL_49_16]|uniref:Uncharacterized protein n=1 Tax=Candidatus Raymondbacteria bacterium RIFOXYD12_FULL_49_13 TaxID=1817890 RepID=A0A1F7FGF4_UNCRA|nr:MAG: hypothetical protein A2248_11735 [Candidatus Raymondbacteria bacterium RIFOXYA2_FULL_49_16]OGK05775.1 MAG: hypothetical protein A2519_03180 [Candidatus Raymondbacteria bacterium RIFOXYD12_FULL_49_13]OGP41766.1 MAG: hypothetical protein A2324_18110 [Candidatus Raymondbacteria bacterium RIFOXYB2_FULL_49_35]
MISLVFIQTATASSISGNVDISGVNDKSGIVVFVRHALRYAAVTGTNGDFSLTNVPATPCTLYAYKKFHLPSNKIIDASSNVSGVRLTVFPGDLNEDMNITAADGAIMDSVIAGQKEASGIPYDLDKNGLTGASDKALISAHLGKQYVGHLLYMETFDYDSLFNWVKEGTCAPKITNGKLDIDCFSLGSGIGSIFNENVWFNRDLDSNCSMGFTVSVHSRKADRTYMANLFFWKATGPAYGQDVLETTQYRSGDAIYDKYTKELYYYSTTFWRKGDLTNIRKLTPAKANDWNGTLIGEGTEDATPMQNIVYDLGISQVGKAITMYANGSVHFTTQDPDAQSYGPGKASIRNLNTKALYDNFVVFKEDNSPIIEDATMSINTGGCIREGAIEIQVTPNPFNPAATITVRSNANNQKTNVSVGIYDAAGRKVFTKALSLDMSHASAFQWNAHGHPAGVYMVKANMENRVYAKQAMFIQ